MVAEPGMNIVVTVAGACQNTVLRSQSGRAVELKAELLPTLIAGGARALKV